MLLICVKREAEYFWFWGWTGIRSDLPGRQKAGALFVMAGLVPAIHVLFA
jgi:hypothetical protein